MWDCNETDHVRSAAVHQNRYSFSINDLNPAASERKSCARKIHDLRRKRELAVEPGLHRVAVTRGYVKRRCSKQCTLMICDDRRNFVRACVMLQSKVGAATSEHAATTAAAANWRQS